MFEMSPTRTISKIISNVNINLLFLFYFFLEGGGVVRIGGPCLCYVWAEFCAYLVFQCKSRHEHKHYKKEKS